MIQISYMAALNGCIAVIGFCMGFYFLGVQRGYDKLQKELDVESDAKCE